MGVGPAHGAENPIPAVRDIQFDLRTDLMGRKKKKKKSITIAQNGFATAARSISRKPEHISGPRLNVVASDAIRSRWAPLVSRKSSAQFRLKKGSDGDSSTRGDGICRKKAKRPSKYLNIGSRNSHGLVAGATGTGKNRHLEVLGRRAFFGLIVCGSAGWFVCGRCLGVVCQKATFPVLSRRRAEPKDAFLVGAGAKQGGGLRL